MTSVSGSIENSLSSAGSTVPSSDFYQQELHRLQALFQAEKNLANDAAQKRATLALTAKKEMAEFHKRQRVLQVEMSKLLGEYRKHAKIQQDARNQFDDLQSNIRRGQM